MITLLSLGHAGPNWAGSYLCLALLLSRLSLPIILGIPLSIVVPFVSSIPCLFLVDTLILVEHIFQSVLEEACMATCVSENIILFLYLIDIEVQDVISIQF